MIQQNNALNADPQTQITTLDQRQYHYAIKAYIPEIEFSHWGQRIYDDF